MIKNLVDLATLTLLSGGLATGLFLTGCGGRSATSGGSRDGTAGNSGVSSSAGRGGAEVVVEPGGTAGRGGVGGTSGTGDFGGGDAATAVCTPGADQTCNDNPRISSLHGHCTDAGTCICGNDAATVPESGRCP